MSTRLQALTLMTLAFVLGRPLIAQTARPGLQPTLRKGVFELQVVTKDSVRIEVARGPAGTPCDQMTQLGIRTVKRGQRWSVRTEYALCYRYDAGADPNNPTWTAWTSATNPKGQIVADSLS